MRYEHLTIMYSLPRSRTQWWRWFMAHGCHALHDPLAKCRHPGQVKAIVDACEGEPVFIADTAAIFFHDRFQSLLPGHRRIFMFRGVGRVEASIRAQGLIPPSALLADGFDRLWQRASIDGPTVQLAFNTLTPRDAAEVFTLVTGKACNHEFAAEKMRTHVDVPLRRQYRNADDTRTLLSYKDPA